MTVTLQFNTMPSHAPLRNFPMHHGRLSLAFAGTVGDRGSLRTERLESPQALAAWFQAAGLATATVDIKPRAYARALELREAIARTAQAFVAHKKPARADIALINSVANSSSPRIALDAKSLSVVDTVREPVGAALARIARDAIEMFGNADERSRLRSCGMDSCGKSFSHARRPARTALVHDGALRQPCESKRPSRARRAGVTHAPFMST